MPTLDELDRRVVALEEDADRSLTVESYTQLRFDVVDRQMAELNGRINKLERNVMARFDKIDARFERIDARFQTIDATLEALPRVIAELIAKKT